MLLSLLITVLLIMDLGSNSFQEREEATKSLLQMGAEAYPPLKIAEKNEDPEIRHRSKIILSFLAALRKDEFRPPIASPVIYPRNAVVVHSNNKKSICLTLLPPAAYASGSQHFQICFVARGQSGRMGILVLQWNCYMSIINEI